MPDKDNDLGAMQREGLITGKAKAKWLIERITNRARIKRIYETVMDMSDDPNLIEEIKELTGSD